MKKFLSLLLAVLMVFTFITQAALGGASNLDTNYVHTASDETVEVSGRLTNDEKAVRLVCVYRTLESIRYLSVEIGTRMRGMPGERRAIEWLISEFDELGLETEIHQFDSAAASMVQHIGYITLHNAEDFYEVGEFFQTLADGTVRRGGPFMPWHGHTWEVGAAANGLISETTQPGVPVTGEIIYVYDLEVGIGTAAEIQNEIYEQFVYAGVDGKIVLIGRAANANIAIAAERAGALALMGHSAIGGRGNFGQASSPNIPAGTPVDIPVLGLALCYGEWLKEMVQLDTVTVDIVTRRYETPYSWNAIGTKPAENDPENAPILMVVGHIDTVIGTPGANDNASGVAVTLEAARALAQLDTPDVEIRFIGFGHEESGLRGAWKYVGWMTVEESARVIGVFNMDMTASADHEYATYWTMATVDGHPNLVTETFMATAERLGYAGILEQSQFSSSDHVPFHNAATPPQWTQEIPWTTHPAGMPAAMGIWMGREHDGMITPQNFSIERFYHTPQDTIEENICMDRLRMCIRIVTAAVFELAMLGYERHDAFMIGDDVGTLRPTADMTRAEAAVVLVRTQLTDFEAGTYPEDMDGFDVFLDVVPGDWFYYYIAWAYDAGWVYGHGDGTFGAEVFITREEFVAMVARTGEVLEAGDLAFDDAADISAWARDEVYTAVAIGWVLGDTVGTFRPQDNIMRAEVATAVNRMLGRVDSNEALAAVELVNEAAIIDWPDVAEAEWYFASVIGAANDHRLMRDDDGAIIRKEIR